MQPVSDAAVGCRVTPVTDLADTSDGILVRRVGDGDEDAFRALFRRHAPTALALARRIVRDPALAEEVVQEAFLAVWATGRRFDERRGTAGAWLMGLVHHRAVDAVRREETQRRRAERTAATDVVVLEDPAGDVAERLDAPDERRAVRRALAELPPDQRQVLELMYFEGLSQSKVAERLSLPLGTVKSRTLFGMRALRTALVRDER